jgi:hypothetical protein
MSRPNRIALVAVAVVVFLVVSGVLARVLSANEAERAKVVTLLGAEARGDGAAAAALVRGCAGSAPCAAGLRATAQRVTRPGRIEVLNYEPATHLSLGGTRGVARVAWRIDAGAPIVQCVGIHRTGDPIGGLGVDITSASPPIGGETGCPNR